MDDTPDAASSETTYDASRGNVFRSFAVTAAIGFANNFVLVLVNVVVARQLGPSGLGRVALLLNLVSLALVVGSAALSPALSKRVAQRRAGGEPIGPEIGTALWITSLTAGGIGGAFILFPEAIAPLIGTDGLVLATRLAGIAFITFAVGQILRAVLYGLGRPVVAAVVVSLGLLPALTATLLLQEILTVELYLIVMIAFQGVLPALAFLFLLRGKLSVAFQGALAGELLRLALPVVVSATALATGHWLARRVLVADNAFDAVGQFQAAMFLQQPFIIALAALGGILLPSLAALQADPNQGRLLLRATIRLGLAVSAAAAIVLVVLAEPAIQVVFGNGFEQAARVAPAILGASVLLVLSNIGGQQLLADERWAAAVISNVTWLLAFLACVWVIPRATAQSVGLAFLVAYAVHALYVWVAISSSVRLNRRDAVSASLILIALTAGVVAPQTAPFLVVPILFLAAVLVISPQDPQLWKFAISRLQYRSSRSRGHDDDA